ncbi:lipopolysaccharide biosynthesis protein [Sphingobacterium composti Ten et al. 2007 non Yoo et al. 2007]|uniref:lipopolysaccharide biosynthesis protein n=1 Tax=Sphingobacterium composti TaxID=363260 RepID=UPI0013594EC3|nr:polysaccharide biosynthesis C-terminal domain-containing protein [Sphingobacterium composti Ten et al. 2007 non Yoo et al. 2007]
MSSIKKLLSDTVIYGLTTIIARVLNFLLTPFFLRKFESSIYGIFTNLYSYAAMINAVLAFGMETTYFRYLQRVDKSDKEKVFNNSFIVTLFATIIFVATMFIFAEPIAGFVKSVDLQPQEYIVFVKLFAVILGADALAVVPFARLRAEGRPIRYGVIKIINITALVFCNLFLLYWLPSLMERHSFWQEFATGWFREGWLGNVFISNLIASVVTLVLLLPQIAQFSFRIDGALMKSMISYSFPILIANISFIINEHLDKMMFPKLIPTAQGEQDLGIYGAVAKIAIFLNLFVTAFRLGAEPFFFSYAKNENAKQVYAKIMDYFIIAMVLVMVGLTANISWLKDFIRGGEFEREVYWSGLNIVPILLFNNVLLGIYMNLSVWYRLSDQTRYGLYISVVGAIITVMLNITLIPTYSYVGAALSTSLTYFVMVTMSYSLGQKNYPIPYNKWKAIFYLALAIISTAGMYYVFDNNVWLSNALLLVVVGSVVYLERNFIKSVAVKLKK